MTEAEQQNGEASQIGQKVENLRYAMEAATSSYLWAWQYQQNMLIDSARKAAGVVAMKQALIDNGFAKGIRLEVVAFGNFVADRTGDFQRAEGLQADEIIGRVTARHLYRKYAVDAEAKYAIPDSLVSHVRAWESQSDPVARSYTGDEGIAQINPSSHPNLTISQIWTPSVAIPFIGSYLYGSWLYCARDWDGAVAAYNMGAYQAQQWVKAGKPATGGPSLGNDSDGNPLDAWAHATFYVSHVRSSMI